MQQIGTKGILEQVWVVGNGDPQGIMPPEFVQENEI